MADTETLPPQEAGEKTIEFDVSDERSAAAAIEGFGILGEASGESEQNSGASAQEDGAQETAPTGEGEGQSEPPATAAIEPPASWSADDKALFSKLPPEAQKIVAQREGERDKLLTQRTQEIADQRKAFETERAAIDGQRNQYVQNLQQLVQFAIPEAAQFNSVDWAKLAAENPAEYVRLSGARDQLRLRVGAIQNEIQRINQEQQQKQQESAKQKMAEESKLLIQKVPDLAKPEKAQELGQHLQARGFTAEEIGTTTDHRLFELGYDAMRWRQAEAARKAAETKRANPAPQVQKPGTTNTGDGEAGRMKEKIQRFGRTNSTRDAASILVDIL